MTLFAAVVGVFISLAGVGQGGWGAEPDPRAHGVFSIAKEMPAAPHGRSVAGPRPERGALVRADVELLRGVLAGAPRHRLSQRLHEYGLEILLPGPDGAMTACVVAESAVMEPELQAKFPDFKTYIVQTVDRTANGRMEVTPRGVTGMLRSTGGGAWMIDAWQSGDAEHVIAYWLADLPGGGDWVCETGELVHDVPGEGPAARGGGVTLRTFRLVLACTGEYGLHHSTIQGHEPNLADPLAAIVTVASRLNVIYEGDMGVHFNLVANNDRVIFFDPLTDPYPTTCDGANGASCSSPVASANSGVVASRIGNNNFDVAQVVTRIAGGVAMSAGCRSAAVASGIPRGGDIDPFSALVVAHEMGHQFGALHTFSGTRGRCQGNLTSAEAWEAGSGSSILAYAGGCPVGDEAPSDNVAIYADPFFHHGSIAIMRNFLANLTCDVETVTANTPPQIVFSTPDSAIGTETAFVLTGEAIDVDGDALTYSWEQFDAGVARPIIPGSDNGAGSLFRIFPPTTSAFRVFPRMSDVLAATHTPGEFLPRVPATRHFRLIVRDNHPGAGGVTISPMVNVQIAGGRISFVNPVADELVHAGKYELLWDVGQTDLPPVSCETLTVRLSFDDGATFDHLLGSLPNNGSAVVAFPNRSAQRARLRLEDDGNIFFAVTPPFRLASDCRADFNLDDAVTSQDFFDFLVAFFDASSGADFNADGRIDSQDLFDFLVVFLTGC